MELKPGYKQSEVGVIPEDWEEFPFSGLFNITAGGDVDPKVSQSFQDAIHCYPIYSNALTNYGLYGYCSYAYHPADSITITARGMVGGANYRDHPYTAIGRVLVLQPKSELAGLYFAEVINNRVKFANESTGVPQLTAPQISKYRLPVPPLPEQRAIAEALSDVDRMLAALDQLIAKKRDLKQAAMQQLMTGRTRLPGFHAAWEEKRIAEVALQSSEKNTDGATLPVLTCSKHFGFMDSLSFFKNQVFSKDLSTYKVIRRDEIGYPANHVEEGSIGLQDLYDIALVSPIYVVFRVTEDVSSFFLHRLLKLDSYRQRFKTATTSSVDRRGSLRWPAFSEITVGLPPTKAEQTAIAAVLSDMERELSALEQRRGKTRALKQAMMQELLTGKTRLL